MSWRLINITDNCHVTLKNQQLFLCKNGDELVINIQEINTVVIDSLQVNLTSAVLSKLSQNNVVVVFINHQHLPISVLLPYHTHHRQLNRLKLQMNIKAVTKKRLWAKIICKKIENQGLVIQAFNSEDDYYNQQMQNVLSNDSSNREAVVAKKYWSDLFKNFTRQSETIENAVLNYGYAILRGIISRSLVAHGFTCSLGIKHCSELNSFNLSDDLMEPWRPFIDYRCKQYLENMNLVCNKSAKIYMLRSFTESLYYNNQDTEWVHAINSYVDSFLNVLKLNDVDQLILPRLEI
jgi:CRISP-associated protein Cas1